MAQKILPSRTMMLYEVGYIIMYLQADTSEVNECGLGYACICNIEMPSVEF